MTWIPSEFLDGDHQFKFGFQLSRRDITGNSEVTPNDNINLMFDTVNGVPNTGIQFEHNNAPVEPDNWDNVYSLYLSDQWRLGQRLTLNLGLRYDYQHSFVPEQTREAGPFTAAQTFPFCRGGQVEPHRAAGRGGVGRHRVGQDGREGDLRQVQHRSRALGRLQRQRQLHDAVALERRES